MGRLIPFTLSATRLAFRKRSGGSFSMPVRVETTVCGSCGVPMPEPPNPVGSGRCFFDTCESCLENWRRKNAEQSER